MQQKTEIFQTADGVDLFVRTYSPDEPDPERVLFWVHGLGEHGGRHEHVAQGFVQRGWTMIVADLRGHGRSGGVPTHVAAFDQYSDDIACLWERLGLNRIAPVLLGHSMGGLIAIRTVQLQRVAPSALVLSSPLLGLKLHVNPLTKLLGRILVQFRPTTRFSNGIDPANLTSDAGFAALRRGDPLINKTVTAGWFFAMQTALAAAERDAALISLPVLAIQGDADRTTDPAAMASWWDRIRSTEKQLVVLPDHLHELFFASDWNDTLDVMLDWLQQKQQQQQQQRRKGDLPVIR
jgi:lysophospholipase